MIYISYICHYGRMSLSSPKMVGLPGETAKCCTCTQSGGFSALPGDLEKSCECLKKLFKFPCVFLTDGEISLRTEPQKKRKNPEWESLVAATNRITDLNLQVVKEWTLEQWKKGPWLFKGCIGDEILPNYTGIISEAMKKGSLLTNQDFMESKWK